MITDTSTHTNYNYYSAIANDVNIIAYLNFSAGDNIFSTFCWINPRALVSYNNIKNVHTEYNTQITNYQSMLQEKLRL